MIVKGVSKRSTGTFIPDGQTESVAYDFVKIHIKYEFGFDGDAPEVVVGDAYDIIKLKWDVWKQFLDRNGLNVADVKDRRIELVYNRYGKPSGLHLLE